MVFTVTKAASSTKGAPRSGSPSNTAVVSASTSTHLPAKDSSSRSHIGEIVGPVVGGIVALLLFTGIIFYFLRRRASEAPPARQPRRPRQVYAEMDTDGMKHELPIVPPKDQQTWKRKQLFMAELPAGEASSEIGLKTPGGLLSPSGLRNPWNIRTPKPGRTPQATQQQDYFSEKTGMR